MDCTLTATSDTSSTSRPMRIAWGDQYIATVRLDTRRVRAVIQITNRQVSGFYEVNEHRIELPTQKLTQLITGLGVSWPPSDGVTISITVDAAPQATINSPIAKAAAPAIASSAKLIGILTLMPRVVSTFTVANQPISIQLKNVSGSLQGSITAPVDGFTAPSGQTLSAIVAADSTGASLTLDGPLGDSLTLPKTPLDHGGDTTASVNWPTKTLRKMGVFDISLKLVKQ